MFTQVSEKLKVAKPKKSVVYRRAGAGFVSGFTTDEHGNKMPTNPAPCLIPPVDTIYDPFDEEEPYKVIRYIKGTGVDVNGQLIEKLGEIEFGKSAQLALTAKDYNLIFFLERCNWNGSNPYRDTNKPIFFYKVEEEKSAEEEMSLMEKKDSAIELLRKLSKDEEGRKDLVTYYKSLGRDAQQEWAIIYTNLRKIVDAAPEEFLKGCGNQEVRLKAEIMDAQTERIIEFDAASSTWKWAKEKTAILPVAKGVDKDVAMFEFCNKDTKGKTVIKEIRKRLTKE